LTNAIQANLNYPLNVNEKLFIYVIVEPDVESVSEESVVEEPVREEERDYDDDQVEELAEDEAKVVDVVLVVNIFGEKLETN
jgi:hypothetical protein